MNFWRKEGTVLKAFFEWASSLATEKDCILVDLPWSQGYFYFTFPLKYGDRPQKSSSLPDAKEVRFIVRGGRKEKHAGDSWISIFSCSYLGILEDKNRTAEIPPLRWKLNNDEKNKALEIARSSLNEFLCSNSSLAQQYYASLPLRFSLRTDLAVAIWANGSLRGSAVLENTPLGEGIAKATLKASRDKRFKPLSRDELPAARIEVTVMQNLRLPLSDNELKQNAINAEKGYRFMEGGKKGWFLPEVFNIRRFASLEQFVNALAREKANFEGKPSFSSLLNFEVDDFIESVDHSSVIGLKGPALSPVTYGEITNLVEKAADWLVSIQESDGNFPAVYDPFSGRITRQIDWPRLAFTAWALAEISRVFPQKKVYKEAAEKARLFLAKYLFDSRYEISSLSLTLAYFGNLCLSLDKETEALRAYASVDISQSSFEPILFSQVAGLSKRIAKHDSSAEKEFLRLLHYLKDEFESRLEKNASLDFASWAELANTFADSDPAFSKKVCDWLISSQLHDGSFPSSSTVHFPYTRGTGKIFEVLSLRSDQYAEAVQKASTWLFSMQYNENSLFFAPDNYKKTVEGAFRHDYLNPEAWIDAAGHVLLGSARMFSQKL